MPTPPPGTALLAAGPGWPGATEVRTLASYVGALGGRLQVTAEFGGESVPLR
jgi:hypothetical protein